MAAGSGVLAKGRFAGSYSGALGLVGTGSHVGGWWFFPAQCGGSAACRCCVVLVQRRKFLVRFEDFAHSPNLS
jgi:hypothetical protein